MGAIQIRKVMERRGQNMGGPMGFEQKKEGKKQGVCHIVALHLPGTVFYKFCHLQ